MNTESEQNPDAINPGKESLREGIVYRKSTGYYWVHVEGEVILCKASSKLRKHLVFGHIGERKGKAKVTAIQKVKTLDPIAIGDRVRFAQEGPDRGMIYEVCERKNKFSRRASGRREFEQVIVANVDQVVPVFAAAQPDPAWGMLDRYLVDCEAAGVPALIVLTKMDLAYQPEIERISKLYDCIGYRMIHTSCETGRGLDELRDALRDKMSVFVGKSGVGKSTLLNALQPGLDLPTQEVMDKIGKGRHTTTHLEMHELDFGGRLVDTPGIRELGIWNEDSLPLDSLFPEFRPYLDSCFFAGCTHTHEPDCAIKEAVDDEHIDVERYESYLKLREEEFE